ncbi:class I SAM-dependent DNA methyltransferase [Cysteiniphilum sp. QT6929]|uniref:class I SAM-dependent DNA methyltransferase n=1 Tax=Cysteiniphilum sp. QT6929 TaxID=2975055 RepID=UPI0024B341D2|nr:class I SAM-dependent DNA methyltransferase [Cysteiniphilum sp. QT6929]WHN64966.1 type I restriction-modification system subunit M [Cysteiniphilum sp. QT6929]
MITGDLKSKIDSIWLHFHTGGVTNPLTVIEQISFLMFLRLLDIKESNNELQARWINTEFTPIFKANEQHLRWSHFKNLPAGEVFETVRDKVFKHMRELADGTDNKLGKYMKDAQLMIQKPSLLTKAIEMIDNLPITNNDVKGDLYEYLLSKLTTAGINGQFRTPRHIINMMVEIMDPNPEYERICDPACGTAGFLVATMEYLQKTFTSKDGIISHEDGQITYSGDLLTPYRQHIQSDLLHGFDFDATMLRIAAMNLMLHGIDTPLIHYQDTLAKGFSKDDKGNRQLYAHEYFDLILANPPFKGSLDADDVAADILNVVSTKKTELLFLALILRMLKNGGRSATIVPDGVLFGSSKAHVAIRKKLVEENALKGVIALPSGVFKPYAGVSTAILIFQKAGKTDKTFYYNVKNDGFSLDDKRNQIADNDLPDLIDKWRKQATLDLTDKTKQAFVVDIEEIRANNYDLSINRYQEIEHQAIEYPPTTEILAEINDLERQIQSGLSNLQQLLEEK